MLDVSDRVHGSIVSVADAVRQRREVVVDPIAAAMERNACAMIDVDYADSPPIADYGASGVGAPGPSCRRYGGPRTSQIGRYVTFGL